MALEASAAWRTFVGKDTSLLGAKLALSFPLASTWLRAEAGVTGLVTNVADSLGNADVSCVAAGAALLATTRAEPALWLGPRIEVGNAHVTGHAEQPSATPRNGNQPIVLASLAAGTRLSLDGHWAVVLGVELGLTAVGLTVVADERTMGALGGPFATAYAGISFAFDAYPR
jgi:hypothetical protein